VLSSAGPRAVGAVSTGAGGDISGETSRWAPARGFRGLCWVLVQPWVEGSPLSPVPGAGWTRRGALAPLPREDRGVSPCPPASQPAGRAAGGIPGEGREGWGAGPAPVAVRGQEGGPGLPRGGEAL